MATGVLVGRVRAGLLGAGAMLGAEVSAQVLKPLLAMQRDVPFLAPAAWPSGHTTAVMGFALALAIVAPPRARPYAVAAGALLTVLTVNAMLMVGSHYPSDVLGGLLLASAWGSAAVLALRRARPRERARPAAGDRRACSRCFALAVLPRTGAAVDYAVANTTFVLERADDRRRRARAQRKRPGSHRGSAAPAARFTPRERMNSRSLRRLR